MQIRFYGVRGSIPTPGPSTVRYGGNSVCVEVRISDGTRIVLDAGTGIRELGKALIAERCRSPIHVFITHSHWDHIMGLPFFAPIYASDSTIVMHAATPRSAQAIRNADIFNPTHFPVGFAELPARFERIEDFGEHRVGAARVRHIELNHPGGATGFRIDDADGSSVCYLTDNELDPPGPPGPPGTPVVTPAQLARFAAGTDLLIHDAQYLADDMPAKRGWGHSVVDQVLALARDAEARTVALHHHDPDRDDDALDAIAEHAAQWTRDHAPGLRAVVAREGLAISQRETGAGDPDGRTGGASRGSNEPR